MNAKAIINNIKINIGVNSGEATITVSPEEPKEYVSLPTVPATLIIQ